MNTIKATVRNGRIEVDEPLDLPDGTELLIPLPNGAEEREEDEPMTPEEIARVLAAMEKIEPFDWTDEERAAADAWEKKNNDWTIANMDKGIEDVFR
jgi:hypothetical protein